MISCSWKFEYYTSNAVREQRSRGYSLHKLYHWGSVEHVMQFRMIYVIYHFILCARWPLWAFKSLGHYSSGATELLGPQSGSRETCSYSESFLFL